MSVDAKSLEAKLKAIHPDLERFGVKISLKFDAPTNAWIATFTKGKNSLSTHIDVEDAEKCLKGIECVHFGVQVGRFVDNYCRGSEACKV